MRRLYHQLAKKATISLSFALAAFFIVEPVLALTPNDPMYSSQAIWEQIKAPDAWDFTTGSRNVVVAMIDTGLDTWHEDLRDNLWVNTFEIPGNNIDDDHNGYVDDINGWNFADDNADVRTSVFDTSDDKEAVRHGTLVGGLIGSEGNNKLDGVGLNWRVSLMTLRAIRSDGNGSFAAVARAVDYAVDNGADVISMSFMGQTPDTRLYDSLRRAYEKGVVVVAAAGNYERGPDNDGNLDKKPFYPGCFDTQSGIQENWILTVGSVDPSDTFSDFSEYGKCLDIVAPGEYVYSTERYAPQYGYPNEFGGPWFGTSFATPIVAGAAALLKAIHPEWGAKEIIPLLLSTTDSIDAQNLGRSGQIGRGRLNVGRAVTAAIATLPRKGLGLLYYIKNGFELWTYNVANAQKNLAARFLNEEIVSVNMIENYDREDLAVVLKKGRSYSLRIVNGSGELITTIPLKTVVTGKISVQTIADVPQLIFSRFERKTSTTDITLINLASKKTTTKSISGQVASWNLDSDGTLFAAFLNNGILRIAAVPVLSKTKGFEVKSSGIAKVLGVGDSGVAAMYLVQRGSNLAVVKVNKTSHETEVVPLGAVGVKHWLLKSARFGSKLFLMPFAVEGGSSIVYDQDLSPLLTVKLPALPIKL